MLFVLLSGVFIALMYLETIKKGMPVKRWLFLGGVFGPVAWCLVCDAFIASKSEGVLRRTSEMVNSEYEPMRQNSQKKQDS